MTDLVFVNAGERRIGGRRMNRERGLTNGTMIGVMRSVVVMMRIAAGGRFTWGPERAAHPRRVGASFRAPVERLQREVYHRRLEMSGVGDQNKRLPPDPDPS